MTSNRYVFLNQKGKIRCGSIGDGVLYMDCSEISVTLKYILKRVVNKEARDLSKQMQLNLLLLLDELGFTIIKSKRKESLYKGTIINIKKTK